MNNFKELILKASSNINDSYFNTVVLPVALHAVSSMSDQDIANANKLISSFNFNLMNYTYDMLIFRANFDTDCNIYLRIGVYKSSSTVFYDLDIALNKKYIFTRRANTFEGVYAPFLEFLETT